MISCEVQCSSLMSRVDISSFTVSDGGQLSVQCTHTSHQQDQVIGHTSKYGTLHKAKLNFYSAYYILYIFVAPFRRFVWGSQTSCINHSFHCRHWTLNIVWFEKGIHPYYLFWKWKLICVIFHIAQSLYTAPSK